MAFKFAVGATGAAIPFTPTIKNAKFTLDTERTLPTAQCPTTAKLNGHLQPVLKPNPGEPEAPLEVEKV